MKAGDLVRVIQGGSLVPPWIGKVGVILNRKHIRQSLNRKESGMWFRVHVHNRVLLFHEDYLEVFI